MPTYTKADAVATALLAECLAAWHKDLAEAGVRVGALFAFATRNADGFPSGPALTHHGSPAAAVVRVTNQRDRVAGLPDALVVIDGDAWPGWPEARRRALLDHELTHLVLVREEDGAVKLDDCNRPKLKTRPHDHEVGVFTEVVERHREACLEAATFAALHAAMVQREFPWGMM